MKAIIHCTKKDLDWVEEYFPGYPAYLLPIGNKPFLEFIVEYCILIGIREIRLVLDDNDIKISEYFGDGTQFGINISYLNAASDTPPEEVIAQNKAFCAEDDIFYTRGLVFIEYNKNEPMKIDIQPESICGEQSKDICYFFCGKKRLDEIVGPVKVKIDSVESCNLTTIPVNSLQAYYQINMRMVYELSDNYNLPGYGSSNSFIVGRNVQIPTNAEVNTPVILGNSVQLGSNSVLGPGAIVGNHSLIDNDANIHNTIVFGNSYVGCNLEIVNKICYRHYLVDPENGIKLDIIDELLLTELVKQGIWRCPAMQRITAFAMLIFYAIPFMILRPLLKIKAMNVECFMDQQRKKKLKLRLYICPPQSISCRWFLKLSLDRYHLLPYVLTGSLRLVGSYILEANPQNAESLKQFPDYAPGIFSYSEYLEHDRDPFQREIDELYYMYHATFWSNFKILKGILLRNLFKQDRKINFEI